MKPKPKQSDKPLRFADEVFAARPAPHVLVRSCCFTLFTLAFRSTSGPLLLMSFSNRRSFAIFFMALSLIFLADWQIELVNFSSHSTIFNIDLDFHFPSSHPCSTIGERFLGCMFFYFSVFMRLLILRWPRLERMNRFCGIKKWIVPFKSRRVHNCSFLELGL